MDAVEVHKKQALMTSNLLRAFVAGLAPQEWRARPAPSANTIGFTVWHLTAVQDWAIKTWISGGLGTNLAPEWAARGMATAPAPFGMSLAEADAVAAAATPADVLEYADAVYAQSIAWLDSVDASFFDGMPPDSRAHLPLHPVYSTEGYREEVDPMFAYPVWRLVSGACYGHARGHLGELDLALQIIRSPMAAGESR